MISWHYWSKKYFCQKKSKKACKKWKFCIFYLQKTLKIQNLILSCMAKNCMKTLFGHKKSPRKPFLIIWGQKKFFAQKIVNFRKNSQKNAFFSNFNRRFFGRKQTKLADFVAEGSGQSSSLPRIFFIRNGPKFVKKIPKNIPPPKKALFGGGF